jgi:hypothetical protein
MLVLGIQKNGRKKKVVHVDNVPNGFKCGCICPNPDCADQLSAKITAKICLTTLRIRPESKVELV